MIKIIIIQSLKEIIWKNRLEINITKLLESWNFNINKPNDGYHVEFKNSGYFLYVVDMGRQSEIQEARNKEELTYYIIYKMTLNIAEDMLRKEKSRRKIFIFQEVLLHSVNERWYKSSKKYHDQINEIMSEHSNYYKRYVEDIKNWLVK